MNHWQSQSILEKIERSLHALRFRIRLYLVVRGLCQVVVWLLAAFWLVVAIDYLPVRLGLLELSREARIVFIVATAIGAMWIVLRQILSPISQPIGRESLALVVERQYPQFHERLITAVAMGGCAPGQSAAGKQLWRTTAEQAAAQIDQIRLHRLLDIRPLMIAFLLAASVGAATAVSLIQLPTFTRMAAQRVFGLSSTPWPRQNRLEMIGVRVRHDTPLQGIGEIGQLQAFRNGKLYVARGSTLSLEIRALELWDETRSGHTIIPDHCSVIYRGPRGSGEARMKRVGAVREGGQLFVLDGPPLIHLIEPLSIEIWGGDFQLGPFEIAVAEPPVVVGCSLACEYPAYLVEGDRFQPRQFAQWNNGMEIPQGSDVQLKIVSNKRLDKAYVREPIGAGTPFQPWPLSDEQTIQFSEDHLARDWVREVVLIDDLGIMSQETFRVEVRATRDQPPEVQARLVGIGSAVTPQAQIPISIAVTDDYGAARTWIEVDNGQPLQDGVTGDTKETTWVIDFLAKQRQGLRSWTLIPGEQSKLKITVKAQDACDLYTSPNVGQSNTLELSIVTPDQLLQILEENEVGLRRRLEGIYAELVTARDLIARTGVNSAAAGADTDETPPGRQVEAEGLPSRNQTRLLFAQRVAAQVQKSTQELNGLLAQFEDLRLQLVNNRLDSESRKQRLASQIIAPLQRITSTAPNQVSMAQLKDRVRRLEDGLQQLLRVETGPASPIEVEIEESRQLALAAGNSLLSEIEQILGVLVKYENQSELLDLVRQIIELQQELNSKTKKARQRQLFEGLLD